MCITMVKMENEEHKRDEWVWAITAKLLGLATTFWNFGAALIFKLNSL